MERITISDEMAKATDKLAIAHGLIGKYFKHPSKNRVYRVCNVDEYGDLTLFYLYKDASDTIISFQSNGWTVNVEGTGPDGLLPATSDEFNDIAIPLYIEIGKRAGIVL